MKTHSDDDTTKSVATDFAHEESLVSSDRPKERLSDDLLGYASFARAIAHSVSRMSFADGVVIAVNGPWGAGKTSAVNMVVDAISIIESDKTDEQRTTIVRFNPWWFSGQHDLTRAFFFELTASLGTSVSKDIRDRLKRIAVRLSGARELLLAGLSFLPGGEALKVVATELAGIGGEELDENKSLSDERNDLQSALRAARKRVLVIIDDIDRLPANEARQIFRLVKSVADLPGIIYLLVFDRDMATRTIAADAEFLGDRWLEKIVQASFDLPPVHPMDLQRLFFQGLDNILGNAELEDRTRWGNVFFDAILPWLQTPRDVVRLLNVLNVSWPAVAGEVNIADFVAIETMRVFEPKLYVLVRRNSDRLTGLPDDSLRSQRDTIGDEILNCVKEEEHSRIKKAMERLFPRLEGVWGSHGYSEGFLKIWENQFRVCSRKRFPTYFMFQTGEDALTRTEVAELLVAIREPSVFASAIEAYSGQVRRTGTSRTAVLLGELRRVTEQLAPQDIADAIRSLLHAGDFLIKDEARGFFDIPAMWRLSWEVDHLLGRLGREYRERIVHDAVENSPSLETIHGTVFGIAQEHGRHGRSEGIAPDERLLEESAVLRLEEALAQRLAKAAADGTLLGHPRAAILLFGWASLANDEVVRVWTSGLLGGNASVLRLAEVVTHEGLSHSMGDRVVTKSYSVERASTKRIVDLDLLTRRVEEVAKDPEITSRDRSIIANFQKGLASDRE